MHTDKQDALETHKKEITDTNKYSRRKFIGTLGLLAGSFVTGCKKDNTQPVSTTTALPTTDYVDEGNIAIYYGAPNAQATINSLGKFALTVVEPALTPPSLLNNSMAYAALGSISMSNHYPDLVTLRNYITSINGFLTNAAGEIVSHGDVQMVDLRMPAVYDAMKAYHLGLAEKFDKGLFFDELDNITDAEYQEHITNSSTKIDGYTDAGVKLMTEVCNTVKNTMRGKTVVVNGGFEERWDAGTKTDVIASVIACTNVIAKESLCSITNTAGVVESWATHDIGLAPEDQGKPWLEGRMHALANAAIAVGKKSIQIFGIEPVSATQPASSLLCQDSTYYNELLAQIDKDTGCHINAQLYLANLNHTDPADLNANLALGTATLCK